MTQEQLSKGNEIKRKTEQCNNAIKMLSNPQSFVKILLPFGDKEVSLPNDDVLILSITNAIRTFNQELEEQFKNL